MLKDISAMTLAEACDEESPERVIKYVIGWCRHEADYLEDGRRENAEIDDAEDRICEKELRNLANSLELIVTY